MTVRLFLLLAGFNLPTLTPAADGGGVITITAGSGEGPLAYAQVALEPPAAVQEGAAWCFVENGHPIGGYSSNPLLTFALGPGNQVAVLFKPIPGWNLPTNGTVVVALGELTVVPAVYTELPAQSAYDAPYTFTTFAGTPPGLGSADGIGTEAQFESPFGVAVDNAGNVFVADTDNCTIRKITPAGVVKTITGLAGSYGTADGTNGVARFDGPQSVAVDTEGNLYVTDTYNHTIRKIAPTGTNWVVSTIAGLAGNNGWADGTNSTALFFNPYGITVDGAGNLYVADSFNSTIRKITPTGTNWVVSTIAGHPLTSGTNDGAGTNALFDNPLAVTVDTAGDLFVADTGNQTIRRITSTGGVSTIAGLAGVGGNVDGTNSGALFSYPRGITVDNVGNVYVADSKNSVIRKVTPVGPDWVVATVVGQAGNPGSADGTGGTALFNQPCGVAGDSLGNLCVADTYNNVIRQVTTANVVSTIAGLADNSGSANGTGREAGFNAPSGVALDNAGNLYVADTRNSTIRRITTAGAVSTIAGRAGISGASDGAGSDARFNNPKGVAVDGSGNVYVADAGNSTIREVTAAGVVSTIAGLTGTAGTSDGTNSDARFNGPSGVAVDTNGNVYVADTLNSTIRRLAPVGTNWTVSTIAGLAGHASGADGAGTDARFTNPQSIMADGAGNLYVADAGNYTIRKIMPGATNWVVTTLGGQAGYNGSIDGTATNTLFGFVDTSGYYYTTRGPEGVAVDSSGNVFVADTFNNTIRRITPAGVVSTIAGFAGSTLNADFMVITNSGSGSADGAGMDARFYLPSGVAVDSAGNLYVADTGNNTIRKGVFTQYTPTNPVPYTPPQMNGQLVVTLLPADGQLVPGQWRFPWDLAWRNSGDVVSNLAADNYTLQFRDVPGYLAIPFTAPVAVTNGGITQVTNQYYPTVNLLGTTNTGALMVNIGPSAPTGAGWRFQGETVWRAPGSTAANLVPDTYDIEFAPVNGYSKPSGQAIQVSASSTTVVSAGYASAQSPPAGVVLPVPVPTNSINDLTDYPYGFNGQLQSEVGYGSGVAVQSNVVLTAAHLIFNDQTLSYVSAAFWYFQEEAGVFSPEPMAARGWYVLSGYAAQRTNDMLGGLGPDQSSPQSRNLDVAALYFPSPVAGGGYGGYLPSDAVPNSWLASTSQKMLVGYPVDGSVFGDATIVPGVMYQIGPQPYPLSRATDPVADQQVYVAPWLLSYPGNSGGPLYVQFNGYYYPAGVYLGTLYNGVVPYASLVRGIDSNVVNLITWAQRLGDAGTNGTGGGVITITSGSGLPGLAYLQIHVGPAAAIAAGGGWRVPGSYYYPNYYSTSYIVPFSSAGSETVEFNQIPGWDLASSTDVTVVQGQLITVSATYTLSPALAVSPAGGLASSGLAGGPFTPDSIACTLSNSGAAPLNWTACKTANWLTLSASSGTLAAGATTNITVSVNANANSLTPGSYRDTVGFTNLNNGLGNTAYPVSLLVSAHPLVQFSGVRLLTNGAVAMTLQGVTGRVYSIVASTNLLNPLTNWVEVLRLTNTTGQTVFTNPPPSSSPRYYRAKEL